LSSIKQADIARKAGVEKAFEGGGFHYVFNLTFDAITYGQSDEVYQQRIVDVSTMAGMAAKQQGVRRFVELSTAQVYDSGDLTRLPSSNRGPSRRPTSSERR